MRSSQFPIHTLKEVPVDTEIISHRLMIRSGMIRRIATGIYTWMPLGLLVLRKIEHIVREEMNRAGAVELLMPAIQPADLWQESQRWDRYGPELLRITDRHKRDFCFGPTHEEVITDIVRHEVRSYKQLPINYYQIQNKFRDEIRPRFGVIRGREFLMKDAYSFHLDQQSLVATYQAMMATYTRILNKINLRFRVVAADSGSIGGHVSHEFHVLSQSGEDKIAFSDRSDFAANIELADARPPDQPRPAPRQKMQKVATPNQRTIKTISQFLGLPPTSCVKTLLVNGSNKGTLVALVLRGDHQLNTIKAAKLQQIADPLTMADTKTIINTIHCQPGSIGPVGIPVPVLVDHSAAVLSDFVCGANEDDFHFTGVNWERDLPLTESVDIRYVTEGDRSPDGQGHLHIAHGIEVGHTFQLGDQYSKAMKAHVLNQHGKATTLTMGCYGMGISRLVAATIEQHHDAQGIIWPQAISPFQIALIPINLHKSVRLRKAADQLYDELIAAGLDVFYDDRKVRPGVLFADMELIGIPHQIIISDHLLDAQALEYQSRYDTGQAIDKVRLPQCDVIDFLRGKIDSTA